MDEMKCQSSECHQHAVAYVKHVQNRQVSKLISLCELHSETHFQDEHDWYHSGYRMGKGEPLATENGVAFDIDFLYWDQSREPPWVWGHHYVQLIEIGGYRNIGFHIGAEESNALNFELDRSQSPRPLTHHAMVAAIKALGGNVGFVEIDKFLQTQKMFEAKLHISHEDSTVIVDVRPSDALIIAHVCKVHIIVSDSVLLSLEIENNQNDSFRE